MRVLIAGAGIAGLTAAALLGRQGHEVLVVERGADAAASDAGYALALWPHGTRVLHSVGVYEQLVARSAAMERYTAGRSDGRVLSSSTIPPEVTEFGHLGLIPRGELIALLRDAASAADIRYGRRVVAAQQAADHVEVQLDDGRVEKGDVLIGADGIGSAVRFAVAGQAPRFDTGWACLVWWADAALVDQGEVTERWAPGSFLGTYPCRDRLCVIAGAPKERFRHRERNADAAAELLRAYGLTDPRWSPQLDDAPTLWPMSDVRAPRWVSGRIALVGDAAAGFLPTAGVGASMALESAAALADELSRTDAASAPKSLALYERRRRDRTESAQTLSRRLARVTFVRSRPVAAVRDLILARSSIQSLVGPLLRDLERPI
ncbi:FAD-dependent monooxygenase [Salinibacterium sp. SYSU T00001]|uniref:FAD-dependent oxidoreductase n=1 Tax=Homoserinimonas sedimenticola TaxID=2986805 RepID=UPI002235E459|nr:NAD(P)/FAD-dependent oxidoreductase [Salinibacterium sedimenticola]MCW4386173.1 FAD-dependent monooxygenase [Salinibacterium sedimenticola]